LAAGHPHGSTALRQLPHGLGRAPPLLDGSSPPAAGGGPGGTLDLAPHVRPLQGGRGIAPAGVAAPPRGIRSDRKRSGRPATTCPSSQPLRQTVGPTPFAGTADRKYIGSHVDGQ